MREREIDRGRERERERTRELYETKRSLKQIKTNTYVYIDIV